MSTRSPIADFLDNAERRGQLNVCISEMVQALPTLSESALSQALHRQQSRGRIVRLSRGAGHWVIVPLQYAESGSPPIEVWLDHYLSRTLKIPYYVALLSAAETFGSSPFAVMATHIMVPKARRSITVGRQKLDFITSNHIDNTPKQWHATPDGRYRVSTPEVTVIELIRRETLVGGMARVRDILHALFECCSLPELSNALDVSADTASAQRLGVLLEQDEQHELLVVVEQWLHQRNLRIIMMESGTVAGPTDKLNSKFKVRVPANFQQANT